MAGGQIHEVDYENTTSLQVVRQFVNNRENFLEELLNCLRASTAAAP
jgi:predicted ATPase